MFDLNLPFINEQFYSSYQAPAKMDALWNEGWRHFGTHFFRYSYGIYRGDIRPVIPLRIRLADFRTSQSQRRVLRKNSDLKTVIRPAELNAEKDAMFDRHKTRFEDGVPDTIHDFLSHHPAAIPSATNEVCIYDGERLAGVSFLNVGENATSAIYAMFEPEMEKRSLGILMILKEIEYSLQTGKEHLHLGYAYRGNSFYDYKKRFSALEAFDWQGSWDEFDGR